MLTKITLTNFKCFREATEFPLSRINLLTGINGRGKSTLLQSLLLMRQSLDHDLMTQVIILNGSCVRLGTFQDILNSKATKEEEIIMRYEFETYILSDSMSIFRKVKDILEYHIDESTEDDMTAKIDHILYSYSFNIRPDKDNPQHFFVMEKTVKKSPYLYPKISDTEDDFTKERDELLAKELDLTTKQVRDRSSSFLEAFYRIHYISADRIGPQDFYLKSSLTAFPNVGAKGENTINLLNKMRDHLVNENLCLGEDAHTLITQTQEWLHYIFDGAKLEIPKGTISVLEPLFNTSLSRDRFKASNIGFGYSYILPIIVAGLIAKNGEILMIENPEAHLHPKAQSRLIQFLAKVKILGVQIFIESHSDHILNALRIAVLDRVISPQEASILYFPQEIGQPVVQIEIQEDGRIEQWPEGFFDQMDKDFERLFGV